LRHVEEEDLVVTLSTRLGGLPRIDGENGFFKRRNEENEENPFAPLLFVTSRVHATANEEWQ
jgi:hypothetical protein